MCGVTSRDFQERGLYTYRYSQMFTDGPKSSFSDLERDHSHTLRSKWIVSKERESSGSIAILGMTILVY